MLASDVLKVWGALLGLLAAPLIALGRWVWRNLRME